MVRGCVRERAVVVVLKFEPRYGVPKDAVSVSLEGTGVKAFVFVCVQM